MNYYYRIACLVIVAFAFITGTGCSAKKFGDSGLLDDIRGPISNIKTEERVVMRQQYRDAVARTEVNARVRIVEIFKGTMGGESSLPEYRVFDIDPASAYYLLGLRNADVLTGAHGYVIKNPGVIPTYIAMLANEKETSLEVRRGGEPLLIKIKFE